MSGVELVAAVVAAFFIIGIAVGVVVVIAISVLRAHRDREDTDGGRVPAERQDLAQSGWVGTTGAGWQEPPGPDDENDDRPRWPSGALSG